ncbi:MAG: hypothetical protein AABY11_03865, partial [archaeon]
SHTATQKLVITGRVEGKRVTLKTIDVTIRTGGTSCLNVSTFTTPIDFISSTLTGSQTQRVNISNKCLEPVRITQVNPSNLSGNTFSIAPLEGSDTLDKDEERAFNVTLSKGNAFKGVFPLTIRGVMILSQQAVESNPVSVNVALGEGELESSHTSNTVEVPVCEGGTMPVRFPVIAQKNECSQAYCDAEQASNMIAGLIEQHIAKAVQAAQAKKNDASVFANCSLPNRYCTFEQMGIAPVAFDLYLQNDALTPRILSYVMHDGTYPRLASMQTELLPGLESSDAPNLFQDRLGTSFGNKLFLPEIQGCGRYRATIVGSIETIGNQFQPDAINVGIILTTPRQKTAECQDTIVNAANFLPKNRSLTALNSQNTLLGIVQYAPSLEEPARWLAETVFGSEERALQNTGSNRMDLQIGNLTQSVVELTLDPNTKGDGTKRIITTIRGTQGQVPKAAVVEAGKIITNLGKSINGCITSDQQTWRINAVKDIGQFTFLGCPLIASGDGGLTLQSALTCCSLTTNSSVVSEVSYSLEPSGDEPAAGIANLDLYAATGVNGNTPGEKIAYGSPYLLPFDTQKQTYTQDVLLCGTADARTQHLINGTQASVSATRLLDDTKAGPIEFELRSCALDADDALAQAYEKGNGVWYATVNWDEDLSQKTLQLAAKEVVDGEKILDAFFSYQGQGIYASEDPVYQDKLDEKQSSALVTYAASCAAACGACYGISAIATAGVTLGAAAFDCVLGCGIPTGVGFLSTQGDAISNAADDSALEATVEGGRFIGGVYVDAATFV